MIETPKLLKELVKRFRAIEPFIVFLNTALIGVGTLHPRPCEA